MGGDRRKRDTGATERLAMAAELLREGELRMDATTTTGEHHDTNHADQDNATGKSGFFDRLLGYPTPSTFDVEIQAPIIPRLGDRIFNDDQFFVVREVVHTYVFTNAILVHQIRIEAIPDVNVIPRP